jgi:3-oxoacyl-[acyl-carrier-protein] synthase II
MSVGAIAITGAGTAPPEDGLPEAVRIRAARVERVTRLALAASGGALEAAGLLATAGAPRPGIGVVLGTAFGCFATNAAYQRGLAERGPAGASPRLFAATVANAAAGEVAIAYRLGGPSVTLTAGAASGVVALGHARALVAAGRADALVAGGCDAGGDALADWIAAGGLEPGRPLAEAAAALVLEAPGAARARGARVLGTVEGFGAGFEPLPAGPRAGEGLAAAIAAALASAAVSAATIALVVAAPPPALAGLVTGALAGAFGAGPPPLLDPKARDGETLGAAGVRAVLAGIGVAAPGAAILVLDCCASGHVAALVARREAA